MMNQKYALQKVFLNMDDGEFLYPVSFHGRYAVDEFMYINVNIIMYKNDHLRCTTVFPFNMIRNIVL